MDHHAQAPPSPAPDSLPDPLPSPLWFALHVNSRCEFKVHSELLERGFESFLPLRRVRRRWSDRVKTLDLPVFPGYLFCRFDLQHRVRVLSVPAVARIVGTGPVPEPVSESEIRSVQLLVASKLALSPWPCVRAGQRVCIDRGPLAGVEGIIVAAREGKPRIVVSVVMLQRAVSAEVERDWLHQTSP